MSCYRDASRFLPRLVVAAAIVLVGVRFFLFISAYSVNVLFLDQWDFLTPFFRGNPRFRDLFFFKWGWHREGLGLFLNKLLYPPTHWNVRAESFVIGGCIFVAMLLALQLKRRLFGSLGYSDVAVPLIVLTVAQAETITGTPHPGYACFPLLMMMMYCLALLCRHRLLRYGCLLLLNFLLIYTGPGLLMGVVTLGVFAFECYLNFHRLGPVGVALPGAGLAIAGASLGSFFLHYTFSPMVDCLVFPYHPLYAYPWFMALMFWSFIGPGHPVHLATVVGTATGALILLSVAAILVRHLYCLLKREQSLESALVGAVLLSYALLFSITAAFGRVCVGLPAAAQQSRYITWLIPAFLAIYFYLLSRPASGIRKLALSLFVVVLVPSSLTVRPGTRWVTEGKRAWVACYERTEDIHQCDQATGFMVYPNPEATGLKEKLDYLRRHRLSFFAYSAAK